jgi:hypothetical protein
MLNLASAYPARIGELHHRLTPSKREELLALQFLSYTFPNTEISLEAYAIRRYFTTPEASRRPRSWIGTYLPLPPSPTPDCKHPMEIKRCTVGNILRLL